MEETKEKKENVDFWTVDEKKSSREKYNCEILISNGSHDEVRATKFPNDAFIVTYNVDNVQCLDLTRGTKTNIFDMYYDKFKQGLKDIDYGRGTVSPKLWGYQSPTPPKKKRKG
tara:strand:- start:206 stop:547 length:342 start_codon:yes stop_codon:yes gene_type:complete